MVGCSDDMQQVREIQAQRQLQMQAQSQQDHLGEVFSLLSNLVELNDDKARRQIAYHLNRWAESKQVEKMPPSEMLRAVRDLLPEEEAAERAKAELNAVLHLFPVRKGGLPARAMTCSALGGKGLDEIWQEISAHIRQRKAGGDFAETRSRQQVEWMYDTLRYELERRFFEGENMVDLLKQKEREVASGREHAVNAALELLNFSAG